MNTRRDSISLDSCQRGRRKEISSKKRAASQEIRLNKPKQRLSLSSISTGIESTVGSFKKTASCGNQQGVKLNRNWSILFDEGVQRYYFMQKDTDEKYWKLLIDEKDLRFILMDKVLLEVQEWQIAFDYDLKRYYFYNHETKRSHWVLPMHEPLLKVRERKLLSSKLYTKLIRRSIVDEEEDNQMSRCSDTDSCFSIEPSRELSITNSEEASTSAVEPRNRTFDSVSLLSEMKQRVQTSFLSEAEEDEESDWSVSDID